MTVSTRFTETEQYFMEKILIAIIEDVDRTAIEEFLNSLKKEKHIELIQAFSKNVILRYGSLEINPQYRLVTQAGRKATLTQYEFDILYLLAGHPGRVFSKGQIYEQIWKTPDLGSEDTVISLIYRIRKKIEPDHKKPIYILTVWGIGYKFNDVLN